MRGAFAVKLTIVALAALPAGCGFRLEGVGALPSAMARTYLDSEDPRSEFTARLADALRLRGTEIVSSPEEADAVLRIMEDDTGQRVLSVTARNIPREYEVFYSVTFTLSLEGERVLEPQSLVAVRSYTYDETQVLGKSAEEAEIRRALAEDLARQVVRRIEALRPSTQTPGV
ncbi:MAG TPA: LPS assembly lipoprotein LptE [Gammaproteobacteria bacterium]